MNKRVDRALLDAPGVNSARDLFERGHAAGDEVVGHQSCDAHHRCAPVVQLLGLKLNKAFKRESTRRGGWVVVVRMQIPLTKSTEVLSIDLAIYPHTLPSRRSREVVAQSLRRSKNNTAVDTTSKSI